MPTLSVVNFNIVCATAGGFVTLFGLVSYLVKENYYLSEALVSTVFGVIFSPHAANFIRPLEYANGNEIDLETITLYFSRLVLGVQLVIAGVQLPSKYLWTERKSLSILLGPGMCAMWVATSLLVWALVPNINFVVAMSVGACVTPTDPVLSNSIVKGKFADKNIPPALQKIIVAESGANDGLGYPFLFLGLYLLKYAGSGGLGQHGGVGHAFALWFYDTWAYVILLSVIYGAVVGWVAKELLHWAEARHFIDRESFLVFAITLALFIVGTVGLIGSDDVLACFVAGNAFTWDDWFRLETMDDSLQPTIDMLLNVSIFLWFGAVCPWHKFVDNSVIPIYRLIPLGILVLLLRRMPMVWAFRKQVRQMEHWRHVAFVGFFGPIGVSAIFYLYVSREFLRGIEYEGHERGDAELLGEAIEVVVWFLVMCSIFVHGLSIPVGKLGVKLPRTISTAISFEKKSRSPSQTRSYRAPMVPFASTRNPAGPNSPALAQSFRGRRPTSSEVGPAPVGRFGIEDIWKAIKGVFPVSQRRNSKENIPKTDADNDESSDDPRSGSVPSISWPLDATLARTPIPELVHQDTKSGHDDDSLMPDTTVPVHSPAAISDARSGTQSLDEAAAVTTPAQVWSRSIKFPDESNTIHSGSSPSGKSGQ